jgi:hypothetical protein
MISSHRSLFNRAFTPGRYAAFVAELERRTGGPIEFRLSETPCFLPASLVDRLIATANTLIAQLLDDPAYRAAAGAIVPARFRLPNGEMRPTFLQVDFGLVETDGGIEGRLVELQGFPSLYGFQLLLAELSRDRYGFPALTPFPGGLDGAAYRRLVGRALVGDRDPNEVVLLEIDPRHQKTRPDFAATEELWGVRAVDLSSVRRRGRRLFAPLGGRLTPIARIYNRVIPDELERKEVPMAFDFRDDLDVEWAGGPDWFYRLSKFSIPWLRHPWVPETTYLGEADALPPDRNHWLLKPLFSFAGGGIVFDPTDADLQAIPPDARRNYILQKRVAFTPVIATPHGPTQAEVRIMMVHDGATYRAVLPLVRMGRGRMMGVDHNKGLAWVGSAAALIDEKS